VIFALVLVSGCYAPSVRNDGYACDPTADKPCPDGFRCIDGVCDDGSGGGPRTTPVPGADLAMMSVDQDMAMSGQPGDDLATKPAADLAQTPADLAQTPPDLAQTPPDLAQACVPLGGACQQDADCCSDWCSYSTWHCIKHP
jgi:hypothetical protein